MMDAAACGQGEGNSRVKVRNVLRKPVPVFIEINRDFNFRQINGLLVL